MSSQVKQSWIDTWWPLLLIAFGVTFVLFLANFPQSY